MRGSCIGMDHGYVIDVVAGRKPAYVLPFSLECDDIMYQCEGAARGETAA